MLGSLLLYAGLVVASAGALSVVRPLAFLGIASRPREAVILAVGLVVVAAAFALPAREKRIKSARTVLDRFVPAWQFGEFHTIRVSAPPDRVYRAVKDVTAREIRLFRTLTAIRRLGRRGPESILNAPLDHPLIEVATQSGFQWLSDEPDEIVLGTVVVAPRGFGATRGLDPSDFGTLRAPGFALAAMNFRIEPAGEGACLLTTETRVFATDVSARRRFAPYWRTIYPGSALIRRMWLRAVRRRAESPPPARPATWPGSRRTSPTGPGRPI